MAKDEDKGRWNVTLYFKGDEDPITRSNAKSQWLDSLTDALVGTGNVAMFVEDSGRLWAIPAEQILYVNAMPVLEDDTDD